MNFREIAADAENAGPVITTWMAKTAFAFSLLMLLSALITLSRAWSVTGVTYQSWALRVNADPFQIRNYGSKALAQAAAKRIDAEGGSAGVAAAAMAAAASAMAAAASAAASAPVATGDARGAQQ